MRWRGSLTACGDIFAGIATAVVFYAEYLALGTQLGTVVQDADGAALSAGNPLALLAAVIACAFALFMPGVYISGPRAASMVVLTSGLLGIADRQGLDPNALRAALTIVLLAASATVLLGCVKKWRDWIGRIPASLLHAFNYATAISLVAQGVALGVIACHAGERLAIWMAFCGAVAVGVLWQPMCSLIAVRARQPWLSRISPLGTLIAGGGAWWAHGLASPVMTGTAKCSRLVADGLDLGQLAAHPALLMNSFQMGLPLQVWLLSALCGVAVGFVLLLESFTALVSVDGGWSTGVRRQFRVIAAANVATAAVGVGGVSVGSARTHALRLFGGHTRMSAVVHGIALAALAWAAGSAVSMVPPLAMGVVLALLGLQMVTPNMAQLWRDAVAPQARARAVHEGLYFWLAVVCAMLLDSALVGFLIGLAAWAVAFGSRKA